MPDWLSDIYESNNKYFELECTYFSPSSHKVINPVTETIYSTQYATRSFILITPREEANLKLDVLMKDEKAYAQVYLRNKLYYEKEIKKIKDREFYLPYPKGNNNLELQDVFCEINFAEQKPVEITGEIHLNIHPHTAYDYNKLTVPGANALTEKYPTMVMLEDGNYKGNLVNLENFLITGNISIGQKYWELTGDFDNRVNYVVSPAGHNRFLWNSKLETNIHYTGGNHNYCIWNNTRNILRSYFKSESDRAVNIIFHMDSIVAQIGGIIGGLSIPRRLYRKSPLIKDLLANEKISEEYVKSYHHYFVSTYINEFNGYFKNLTITTYFGDKVLKKSFKGKGLYNKEINFIYK